MVTDAVENKMPADMYDPDEEAPNEYGALVGKLVRSVLVDGDAVFPDQGAENERIVDQVKKYAEKAGNYGGPCWVLEAEGISVQREDGQPFRQSDIIKLKSTNKDGTVGRTSSTPNAVAKVYTALGVTASYAHVGEENSAVGRTFSFNAQKIKLGGGYEKPVKLFPVELMEVGFTYDGEVRKVQPKADGEQSGASADGGASNAPSEAEVIELVQAALVNKTPADMMQAILDEPKLASVATIFGVPLLDSATDESLATVLQENRCMAVDGAGRLQVI